MKVLTTLTLFAVGLVGIAVYCCHEPDQSRTQRLERDRMDAARVSIDEVYADTGTPLLHLTHDEMVAEIQRQRLPATR